MSRVIRRNLAGTRAQFETIKGRYPNARLIINADVYWDESGTLILVAPEAWSDYFHGKRSKMPGDDVLDDGQAFEFDENEFRNLMGGRI